MPRRGLMQKPNRIAVGYRNGPSPHGFAVTRSRNVGHGRVADPKGWNAAQGVGNGNAGRPPRYLARRQGLHVAHKQAPNRNDGGRHETERLGDDTPGRICRQYYGTGIKACSSSSRKCRGRGTTTTRHRHVVSVTTTKPSISCSCWNAVASRLKGVTLQAAYQAQKYKEEDCLLHTE